MGRELSTSEPREDRGLPHGSTIRANASNDPPGPPTKAAAQRILTRHVADAALRREGVIDPHLDAIAEESQRSIESHLTDF